MAIIRLYDKNTKTILESDSLIIIDNNKYNEVAINNSKELFNGYGKIYIDENDNYLPKYKDVTVFISVEKATNDYTLIDTLIEETNYFYGKEVNYRDYLVNDAKKRIGDIVKYKDNAFHVFKETYDKSYDVATNSLKFDFNKFKDNVIKKIEKSNEEIRQHGYYWDLRGEEYLQPFREIPTNDMTTLKQLRDDTPEELRAIKVFYEDAATKTRVTENSAIKWLKGKVEAPEFLFTYLIQLTNGYHSYLSEGILEMVARIKLMTSESDIRHIEQNYVELILRGLKSKIMALEYVKTKTQQLDAYYTSKNIKPLKDSERGG
mgnify:FL=1